jgi:hypothetical protein
MSSVQSVRITWVHMSSVRSVWFKCQAFGLFVSPHCRAFGLLGSHVKRLACSVHMSSVWFLRLTCQAFGLLGVKRFVGFTCQAFGRSACSAHMSIVRSIRFTCQAFGLLTAHAKRSVFHVHMSSVRFVRSPHAPRIQEGTIGRRGALMRYMCDTHSNVFATELIP